MLTQYTTYKYFIFISIYIIMEVAKKKFTKCTVVNSRGTKVLQYQNERTGRKLPITVGARGGISVKPPGKTRRYMKSVCKKTQCSKNFWKTRDAIVKARKEGRKKAPKTQKRRN